MFIEVLFYCHRHYINPIIICYVVLKGVTHNFDSKGTNSRLKEAWKNIKVFDHSREPRKTETLLQTFFFAMISRTFKESGK